MGTEGVARLACLPLVFFAQHPELQDKELVEGEAVSSVVFGRLVFGVVCLGDCLRQFQELAAFSQFGGQKVLDLARKAIHHRLHQLPDLAGLEPLRQRIERHQASGVDQFPVFK